MPEERAAWMRSLRAIYGPAMLNGPFAIVLGFNGGMLALNDRIKLRPLVAARQGSRIMVASEASAIRTVMPTPDDIWMPKAGEPVIARVKGMDWPLHGDVHAGPADISFAVSGVPHAHETIEVAV
jgi:glutamate synthase domain-containing protein 1